MVLFNLFFYLLIYYKLVVRSRGLIRFKVMPLDLLCLKVIMMGISVITLQRCCCILIAPFY